MNAGADRMESDLGIRLLEFPGIGLPSLMIVCWHGTVIARATHFSGWANFLPSIPAPVLPASFQQGGRISLESRHQCCGATSVRGARLVWRNRAEAWGFAEMSESVGNGAVRLSGGHFAEADSGREISTQRFSDFPLPDAARQHGGLWLTAGCDF